MAGPISKLRKAIKTFREFDPEMEYLNGAVSHYDLERRQREIDQGRFRNRPHF